MTDGEPDTGLAGAFCHTCGTMPTVHRRTLLASFVAGVGVSGLSVACTSTDTATRPPTGQDPPPPDPQLTDLADEQQLLDRYDATMAAHPDLTSRLTPLRAHHADHASALQRLLGSAAGGAVPSPAASDPVTLPSSGPSVPADATGALAALHEAEHAASGARARSCVSARADRAALLGSIAACEASHEVLLR